MADFNAMSWSDFKNNAQKLFERYDLDDFEASEPTYGTHSYSAWKKRVQAYLFNRNLDEKPFVEIEEEPTYDDGYRDGYNAAMRLCKVSGV